MRTLLLILTVLTTARCKEQSAPVLPEVVDTLLVKGSASVTFDIGRIRDSVILERETGRLVRVSDGTTLFPAIVPSGYGGVHVAAADTDGTKFDDLFISAESGQNRFLRWSAGKFHDSTKTVGLPNDFKSSFASAFVDYDLDGDLDLYVAQSPSFAAIYAACEKACGPQIDCTSQKLMGDYPNRLFRNEDNGKFAEVPNAAGANDPGASLAVTFADFNHDGWFDLYVANDYGPDHLYQNVQGEFQDITDEAGISGGSSMGVATADFDLNGWEDIYVTRFGRDTLFLNQGNGQFRDASTEWRVPDYSTGTIGWQIVAEDWNHDNSVDLVVARGHWDPSQTTAYGSGGSIIINHGSHFEEEGRQSTGSWGILPIGDNFLFLHPTSSPQRVKIPPRR